MNLPEIERFGLLDAALGYAARGWPVLPLHSAPGGECSCGRADCSSPGKHPRTPNGLDDATTDPDTIRSSWARWPDANVGLRTGVAFDVLDLDGLDALDALDAAAPAEAGVLIAPTVLTGRGVHLYFAATGTRNRARMLVGVDWRGDGGYVVAPPSMHASGVLYEWGDLGPDTSLVEPPAWLRAVVTRDATSAPSAPQVGRTAALDRYAQAALDGELGRLMRARNGERNTALNAAAFALGQLVAGGQLDRAAVVAELVHAGRRLGLGEREVERTIVSGLTSGAREPRSRRAVAS